MGQTLSEPITEKHSRRGGTSRQRYGFSEMQGWRVCKYFNCLCLLY